MSKGKQLRDLMTSDGMVLAPGAYDGLTAKLVAQAEFSAVYMTGAGTSCSHGYPDYGLWKIRHSQNVVAIWKTKN